MIDARPESDRLQPLLASMLDGQLTDEQVAELREMLASDLTARRRYVRQVATHGMLQWAMGGQPTAGPGTLCDDSQAAITSSNNIQADNSSDFPYPSPFPSLSPLSSPPSIPFVGGPVFSYMVATVVLCAMLLSAWAYKITLSDGRFVDNSKPYATPMDRVEFVGRITGMADCRWSDPDMRPYAGSYIPLGRKYELASGLMEITYASGARVILEGPCSYIVDSDAGGYLALGKLTARVEKKVASAKPQAANHNSSSLIPHPSSLFSVTTPTAVVTDLGTEFAVEIDKEGSTTSVVFKGSIKVQALGAVGEKAVILRKGEASIITENAGDIQVSVLPETIDKQFVRRFPRCAALRVYNTGWGLEEGDVDPHWQIVMKNEDNSQIVQPAYVTQVTPDWLRHDWRLNNPADSQWLSTGDNLPDLPPKMIFTFRTSFKLNDFSDLKTVVLNCQFIVDDHIDAIRLNGCDIPVPPHGDGEAPFVHFVSFAVREGFIHGTNNLEFDVRNGRIGGVADTPMLLIVRLSGSVKINAYSGSGEDSMH